MEAICQILSLDRQVTLLSLLSSAPRHIVCSAAFPLPCDILPQLVRRTGGEWQHAAHVADTPCVSPAPHCESPYPLCTAGNPCLLFQLFRLQIHFFLSSSYPLQVLCLLLRKGCFWELWIGRLVSFPLHRLESFIKLVDIHPPHVV